MAPKKKNDEVEETKTDLRNKADAVTRAANKALGHRSLQEDLFRGAPEHDWEMIVDGVDDLDAEFERDEKMNSLKQKFERGDIDVRVMQVGPDGRLTDVSDKVNPRDLRPDQIEGIHASDGRSILGGGNPQTAAEAIRLLQRMIPGLRLSSEPKTNTANSIRRMEAALAEGDKILEHWKK